MKKVYIYIVEPIVEPHPNLIGIFEPEPNLILAEPEPEPKPCDLEYDQRICSSQMNLAQLGNQQDKC